MKKVDRLGWAAGFAFTCQGVRVGIRANTDQALEQVFARLPPGWEPSPGPIVEDLCSLLVGGTKPGSTLRRFSLLYWGSSLVARDLAVEEVLEKLESFLHLMIAVRARRRQFVRAAVAGWRGNAILILGPRSSGRSTLLGALLRAGAAYYSDRYAVLDTRGRVHPYPTPLPAHLGFGVEEGGATGGRPEVKRAARPLPVGLVVDTRYDAGARCRPRKLSPGESLFAMLKHAVDARLRPQAALTYLHGVATRATALRGKRGEAEEAAAALLRQLGGTVRAGKMG
jgi:hypothetical protein